MNVVRAIHCSDHGKLTLFVEIVMAYLATLQEMCRRRTHILNHNGEAIFFVLTSKKVFCKKQLPDLKSISKSDICTSGDSVYEMRHR